MLVHAKVMLSETNGPGKRAVIWFRGCLLCCKGCFNPETWNFLVPGVKRESAEMLIEWLGEAEDLYRITGVTFSGGEPMHQAISLEYLCECIKDRWPDFSIGMFTGYTQHELDSGEYKTIRIIETGPTHGPVAALSFSKPPNLLLRSTWFSLKNYLDFAIMGRYVQSRPSKKPYLGSSNQEIVLFSSRYQLEDFGITQQMEVTIESDGLIQVTGFPKPGMDLSREL